MWKIYFESSISNHSIIIRYAKKNDLHIMKIGRSVEIIVKVIIRVCGM